MKVYLDYSATTYTDKEVLKEMLPYFTEIFGNSSSQHSYGQDANHAIDKARHKVAVAIGAKLDNEIYFTSGGTESDNFAVQGVAEAYKDKGNHIITTAIEHPAVLNNVKELEARGFTATYLEVDSEGIISMEDLRAAITDKTILITIMASNNEIGSIQPIAEIGALAKEKGILFHTDAVQSIGTSAINVQEMNIDLISLSAHKFYGPKGIGAIYIRNGVKVTRHMIGGSQERGRRASTLNTAGIVGLGYAIEMATESIDIYRAHTLALRDHLVKRILDEVPYAIYNGPKDNTKRMPNNASISFQFVEGESLLLSLDMEGIAISSGSACSSGSLKGSHVLEAIGLEPVTAQSTVRFSLGKSNTLEEINYTVEAVKRVMNKLRKMSPLFNYDKGEPIYV